MTGLYGLLHRAHPRVSGENIAAAIAALVAAGSSPRERGKLFQGEAVREGERLIPA